DPTFHARVDEESAETIISGMGELHLDVYVERMKREYGAEVETGAPQVAYREAISRKAEFNHTHKKQTGGSGQYGRVAGYVEPMMKVSVEGPLGFQGAFVRTIMQRRGIIIGTTDEEGFVRVDTEVPLAEMFGYSTDLRSSSQGKAEYTMEFSRYAPVPAEVHLELVKKYGTGLIAADEE